MLSLNIKHVCRESRYSAASNHTGENARSNMISNQELQEVEYISQAVTDVNLLSFNVIAQLLIDRHALGVAVGQRVTMKGR